MITWQETKKNLDNYCVDIMNISKDEEKLLTQLYKLDFYNNRQKRKERFKMSMKAFRMSMRSIINRIKAEA